MKRSFALTVLSLLVVSAHALDSEVEGELEFEVRNFFHDSENDLSKNLFLSFASQIEFGIYDQNDAHALIVKVFGRADSSDSRRSHGDFREAKYRYVNGDFELTVGIDKIFWGVTEFIHLVDIINQTDFVESVDREQKLGQAMVRTSYVSQMGTFTGFFMPYFNPRTFPGRNGRPAGDMWVNPHRELYESSDGKYHDDFALRTSNTF